jgi:hypothetical protein
MESDFNELKKIMSEKGQAVPPGFAWEDNKDAIFAKMEALQGRKASRKRSVWIILLLFLLISISTCTAILLQQDKNIYAEKERAGTGSAPVSEPHLFADTPEKQATVVPKVKVLTSSTQNVHSNTERRLPENRETTLDDIRSAATTMGGYLIDNYPLYSESTKSQNLVESLSNKEDQGSKISTQNARKSFLAIEELDPLGQINVPAVQSTTHYNNILAVNEVFTAKAKFLQKAGWINFSSGLTLWNEGYGSSSPQRSAYERTLPSYFGRLSYQHVFRSGWTLSAGIQYIRLESEFERTFTIEDYKIVLKDTIIKVQTNSLTGDSQTIRGDKVLEVSAKRRVRHYNSIQIVQLPIELGKRWSGRHFGSEIAGGPIFNFYSQRKGRTSVNDELLIYSGRGAPIFNNQLHISAMVAGRIHYRFTPMVDLSLGIQYQQSVSNWSGEAGVTMRPQVFLFEIGMRQRIY